jgi:hypothetical protein
MTRKSTPGGAAVTSAVLGEGAALALKAVTTASAGRR